MKSLFDPITITGSSLNLPEGTSTWQLQDRLRMIESFQALENIIDLYKANPTLDIFHIQLGTESQYDDNGHYEELEFSDLRMTNLAGEVMAEFTVEGQRYCTDGKYYGDQSDEELAPWYECGESFLYEVKENFEALEKRGGFSDVTRNAITPFLGESYSFEDAMKRVFGWELK